MPLPLSPFDPAQSLPWGTRRDKLRRRGAQSHKGTEIRMSLRGPKGRGNLLRLKQKALILFDIGSIRRCSEPALSLSKGQAWLALNWLCFFAGKKRINLHNILSYRHLRSFRPFANWLCFFKLSSNFRRFLLFFTCFFHYFGFFSSIFLNSQFFGPGTAGVRANLYFVFCLLWFRHTTYEIRYTNSLSIIRTAMQNVWKIPNKSPWDGVNYSWCVLRSAYCVRNKDIQTCRMAQLCWPAVRRPQGNADSWNISPGGHKNHEETPIINNKW